MIQLIVSGDTKEELVKGLEKALAIVAGKTPSAKDIAETLNASDKARLRGDATVVDGKEGKGATADKGGKSNKNSKAKDKSDEGETGDELDDALGEDGGDAEEETFTRQDVHKLLVEVKDAYKSDATTITKIVTKFGVKKFTEIPDAQMGDVAKIAKEYLAKAKKK